MCRLSGPLTTLAATIGLSRLSQPLREENPPGRCDRHDFRAHYRVFWFCLSGYGANWLGNGRFPVSQFWRDRRRFGGLTCYISANGARGICRYGALECPKNGRKNVGGVAVPRAQKRGVKRARMRPGVPGVERRPGVGRSIMSTQTPGALAHWLQAIGTKTAHGVGREPLKEAQKTARQTPGRVLVNF